MKMFKKICITLIMMAFVILSISNYSKALSLTDILSGGDKFLESSNNEELFNSENEQSAIDQIYYIMLGIGIVLALVIGIVIGIQFITSGVTGQAKVKEKLIPFAIGCFIIFGAFGIWRIVLNVANNALPKEEYGPQPAPTVITPEGNHGGGGRSF